MAYGLMKTLGLAGAAFAAWYFLDPKNGADRRQKVAKGARDTYDTLGKELGRIGGDVAKGARDTYDTLGKELGRIGGDIATGVTDTVNRVGEMVGLAGQDGSQSTTSGAKAAERV